VLYTENSDSVIRFVKLYSILNKEKQQNQKYPMIARNYNDQIRVTTTLFAAVMNQFLGIKYPNHMIALVDELDAAILLDLLDAIRLKNLKEHPTIETAIGLLDIEVYEDDSVKKKPKVHWRIKH
jgi:hypothetical protein